MNADSDRPTDAGDLADLLEHEEPSARRRRRREDLFRPLVAALAAALVVIGVLTWSLLDVASTARTAARSALANTDRIDAAERGFCGRLQAVRSATNRNGAIIFVVLSTVADNVERAGAPGNEQDYRRLGSLPQFQPATDCERAVADPLNYRPGDAIPFKEIAPQALRDILGG